MHLFYVKILGEKNDSEILYNLNYGALSCIDYHPHEHMLALSFWDESIPVHVYIYEETGIYHNSLFSLYRMHNHY